MQRDERAGVVPPRRLQDRRRPGPRFWIDVKGWERIADPAAERARNPQELLHMVRSGRRRRQGMGEEEGTAVRGVADPSRHAGQVGEEGGLERLLEENGQVEACPPQLGDQRATP